MSREPLNNVIFNESSGVRSDSSQAAAMPESDILPEISREKQIAIEAYNNTIDALQAKYESACLEAQAQYDNEIGLAQESLNNSFKNLAVTYKDALLYGAKNAYKKANAELNKFFNNEVSFITDNLIIQSSIDRSNYDVEKSLATLELEAKLSQIDDEEYALALRDFNKDTLNEGYLGHPSSPIIENVLDANEVPNGGEYHFHDD